MFCEMEHVNFVEILILKLLKIYKYFNWIKKQDDIFNFKYKIFNFKKLQNKITNENQKYPTSKHIWTCYNIFRHILDWNSLDFYLKTKLVHSKCV